MEEVRIMSWLEVEQMRVSDSLPNWITKEEKEFQEVEVISSKLNNGKDIIQ